MTRVEELFRRHHLSVFRYLRRMTNSHDQAEDLTQEVFLRAARSVPDDPRLQERAWLFRIARNVLLNRRRDDTRRLSTMPLEGASLADGLDGAIPSLQPPGQEEVIDLERALADLDEEDRNVFLMRELGGLGYEEIGGISDLSPDAVRSRIYRARISLRATLSGDVRRQPRRPSTELRP